MAQIIHILPERLCNQIAAGEVVERPASVVKELIENSLDAGATSILVEVEQGGKRLVRVTDNGVGMSRDDAFLCLERHATSKLKSEDDLGRLLTLGFRGEALPSIAAVSRMLLRTRAQDSLEAWEIYLEGGQVKRADAAGAPVGTTIEVRNLFYNLPARRKFLRTDETEFGHIADMVGRLALARPPIQFQLIHNGRSVIDVNRQSRLAERFAELLGPALLRDMVPVDRDRNGLRLHGLVSEPTLSRPSANAMYTYINGRHIRDRVVHHAVREGYRNLIMKGRHPVLALFLDMDPSLVDVNVHPTKHEVRFRDQAAIHDFIAESVRDSLASSSRGGRESIRNQLTVSTRPTSDAASPAAFPVNHSPAAPARQEPLVREIDAAYRPARSTAEQHGNAPVGRNLERLEEEGNKGFFGSLEVIGQFHSSYILCQDGSDLVLVDQHAAHERIAFEKLKEQYREAGVQGQQLLFPLVLDFDHREAAVLEQNMPLLEQLGFDLEPFGGPSYALKGAPGILADREGEELLRKVVGELAAYGRSALMEEVVDGLLILMACHRVVRANQLLCQREIEALLNDLDRTEFNAQCPHGRPVFKRITLAEVERMFRRT
ncbi:MAG: DNA mismatch repair endonuclease MutL [Syntrophotaleaceae bacterium]